VTSLTSCYVTILEEEGSLSRSESRAKMPHLGEHSRNTTPASLRYFPEVIRRPWISAAPSFHCPSICPPSALHLPSICPPSALPAPLCPPHALVRPSGRGTRLEPQCLPNGINTLFGNATDLFFNLIPIDSVLPSSSSPQFPPRRRMPPICCYVGLNLSIISNVSSESSLI
jgi:hypothetical protein